MKMSFDEKFSSQEVLKLQLAACWSEWAEADDSMRRNLEGYIDMLEWELGFRPKNLRTK